MTDVQQCQDAPTPDVVLSKVKQMFSPEDASVIMDLLNYYGAESYEYERERVQLAILKLSDGDVDKLLQDIATAKSDYRDVLAWAEYPQQIEHGFGEWHSLSEEQAATECDRQQYLNWLNSNI